MKNILFIGNDNQFFKKVQSSFLSVMPDDNFNFINIDLNSTSNAAKEYTNISLVFVSYDEEYNSRLSTIVMCLKQSLIIANDSCIIVSVESSSDLKKAEQLINYGANYFFVIDNNLLQLVRESYSLAFTDNGPYPQNFDFQSSVNAKAMMYGVGKVCNFSLVDLNIQTHFIPDNNQLFARFNFFNEFPYGSFKIGKSKVEFNNFKTYSLKIPYISPNDIENNSFTQKESVSTWIESNKETIKEITHPVLLINLDCCSLKVMSDIPYNYGVPLTILKSFKSIEFNEEIGEFQLILLSLPKEDQNNDEVENFFSHLVKLKRQPLVVILNNNSTNEALRKLFKYSQIISYSKTLDSVLLDKFMNIFSQKKINDSKEKHYYFKPGDIKEHISIGFSVDILAITEHFIIFNAQQIIPVNTCLMIGDKFHIYIMITSVKVQKSNNLLNQYCGLFNGMDLNKRNGLGQFILDLGSSKNKKRFFMQGLDKLLDKEDIPEANILEFKNKHKR